MLHALLPKHSAKVQHQGESERVSASEAKTQDVASGKQIHSADIACKRRFCGHAGNAVALLQKRLMAGVVPQTFPKVSFLRGITLLFLLILCLLAMRPAVAKCPFVGYAVSGTVTGEDGKVIAGAVATITSVGEFFPQHPVIATTDERGEYLTPMRFDTYSGGGVNGDDCFRKPGRVDVRIDAGRYNPASKVTVIGEGPRAVADFVLVRSPQ